MWFWPSAAAAVAAPGISAGAGAGISAGDDAGATGARVSAGAVNDPTRSFHL